MESSNKWDLKLICKWDLLLFINSDRYEAVTIKLDYVEQSKIGIYQTTISLSKSVRNLTSHLSGCLMAFPFLNYGIEADKWLRSVTACAKYGAKWQVKKYIYYTFLSEYIFIVVSTYLRRSALFRVSSSRRNGVFHGAKVQNDPHERNSVCK